MDYNLLITFAKVSELGSFTKAAKVLNQPKSRVSRAISRLEANLGVQLIRRTTRKTSLTSNGQDFYLKISPLLNSLNNELINVSNQQQEMSGTIRITAPQDLGQTVLVPIIANFNSKYPDVEIQTLITNDVLDLTKENIDLSFRAGKLKDSSLIQRKFMTVNFIIVCSQKYLDKYGCPSKIKDLENHKFLSFRGLEKDYFDKTVEIKPIVKSDSISMLLSLAVNSTGVAILPDYFCREQLKTKKLIRLFPSWQSKTGHIHILYPPNKNVSARTKKFIEMAKESFL